MSRIDELIERLCPDGVEYKPVWELTIWDKRFNRVDRNKQAIVNKHRYLLANELDELETPTGNVKLLTTSPSKRFTNESLAGEYLKEGEIVCIPWGGNANIQYYRGLYVTSDNRIATSKNTNILDNRYLYHCFKANQLLIESFYRGSGIKHPDMVKVLDMRIPVPPMEIQQEIVRVLDSFAELEAELEVELEARHSHYAYYRNELLDFSCRDDIRWMKLGDVCSNVCSGGTPSKAHPEYYENGTIPWLRTQEVDWCDIVKTGMNITEAGLANSSAKWIEPNCVIVAMYGATAGKAAVNKIPLVTNQACCNLQVDESIARYRYVYQWICNEYERIKALGQGSQSNISGTTVKNYPIPVPSLEEQERIVAILDKFDALVNDISQGLPAEIEARRKQYAYYRDRLFSFKELVA